VITVTPDHITWANWAGNQQFRAELLTAASEAEVANAVATAYASGGRLRVAGSGHSFTPIVETPGTLVQLVGSHGLIAADGDGLTADVWAHTPLRELGPQLWEAGVSLRNQGDTDSQTIAGATATGTKGSGLTRSNMSSEILALTVVDGRGDLRVIDEASGDDLRAARVSLGLLGIATRLRLRVEPRYGLSETNEIWPLDAVLAQADERLATHRHFSFCWCPADLSASRFALPPTPAGHCLVKWFDAVPADDPAVSSEPGVAGPSGRRVGRSYLIYPDWADQAPEHIELEYMLPAARWREAFAAVRELMLNQYPLEITPVQVRWQKADDAYLSAQYARPTVSIALVSPSNGDYDTFLEAVHHTLLPFDPRPHWGKTHYFTAEQVAGAFPELPRFRERRAQYDPGGVFLNAHTEQLIVAGRGSREARDADYKD
jgi:FAD/FMN-containing dehydrogenase